jgi:hypothetical protein
MERNEETQIEETLVEMAYRWGDVEKVLPNWTRRNDADLGNPIRVGAQVARAVDQAFRVEAYVEEGITRDNEEWQSYTYSLLFDVENQDAREASTLIRTEQSFLEKVVAKQFGTHSDRA